MPQGIIISLALNFRGTHINKSAQRSFPHPANPASWNPSLAAQWPLAENLTSLWPCFHIWKVEAVAFCQTGWGTSNKKKIIKLFAMHSVSCKILMIIIKLWLEVCNSLTWRSAVTALVSDSRTLSPSAFFSGTNWSRPHLVSLYHVVKGKTWLRLSCLGLISILFHWRQDSPRFLTKIMNFYVSVADGTACHPLERAAPLFSMCWFWPHQRGQGISWTKMRGSGKEIF